MTQRFLTALACLGAWAVQPALAQDDLMDFFDEPSGPQVVTSTFKAGRIINVQSPETCGRGEMNFIIAHRFGRISDGAYALWGLDNAQMRMGLDYGLTDRLQVGVARSTFGKTLEALSLIHI